MHACHTVTDVDSLARELYIRRLGIRHTHIMNAERSYVSVGRKMFYIKHAGIGRGGETDVGWGSGAVGGGGG